MRESELLEAILADPPPVRAGNGDLSGVPVGPGDDLAVLSLATGVQLLVGVDQVVDGVHVDASNTPWDRIAVKAVGRCVSDVAAMAARPLASVIAVTLPRESSAASLKALRVSLGAAADALAAPLVGGDIAVHRADGPLTIAVTVLATMHGPRCVLRSGAQRGDRVFVSGVLGGAWQADGGGRHLDPSPRVALGQALLDILGDELHAMIDVSDGLGRDVARVAVASDVSVELDGSALPCAPGATWRQAIGDGEDYELCFTVGGAIEVPDVLADVPLTCVGTCAPAGGGPPVMVRTPEGELQDAGVMGWDHGA